ncbi:unannotated protein [freshwater metagenome]|uniref:Unannotated protein n=1 Tax=freshwater metagenome TaxID=449393 RepID=A0A6J6ID82_9ZZZZ
MRSTRSSPGLDTSSVKLLEMGSCSSIAREIARVVLVMSSMLTPPSRSTVTRSTGPACSRSNSSRPSAATNGSISARTRADTLIAGLLPKGFKDHRLRGHRDLNSAETKGVGEKPTPSSVLPNDCDGSSVDPSAQKRPPGGSEQPIGSAKKPLFRPGFWFEFADNQ